MYIMNMWKCMDHSKYNFYFITFGDPLFLYYKIPDVKGHEIFFPNEARKDPELLRQCFTDAIKKNKIDVVHLNTDTWSGFMLEEVARECNVAKIIVHSHCTGLDLEIESQKKRQEKHFMWRAKLQDDLATDYCACSKKAAEWLYGDRIDKEKIKILHNAIDAKKYIFSEKVREDIRKKKRFRDKFIVGLVANLVPAKNHLFLIEVFSEVLQEKKNAVLWLIGSGSLLYDIQDRVAKLGILDRICFEGSSTEVYRCLQAMDVFCMPSNREGLPIALVEAQASGLKCLVSENVTEEACIADYTKRLPLDIKTWKEAILKLSKGYNRKDAFDDIVESGFDVSVAVKEIEELYSS